MMQRSNRTVTLSIFFCTALIMSGCATFKFHSKEKRKETTEDLKEIRAANAKGDSVASVKADLKKKDSATVGSSSTIPLAQTPAGLASELYLKTLDNYLAIAPTDEKVPEILLWKGNHLYNIGDYNKALDIYKEIRNRFPTNKMVAEAMQMTAQAYSQLGKLDEAEKTYRTILKEGDASTQSEAKDRLAQSIYLQADTLEKAGKMQEASDVYMRVPKEFPTVEIAPIAMFNSGVMQEKQKKWKAAIEIYGKFFDAYFDSKLLAKVLFREAKCRELDGQWQIAGSKYLNLVKAYPDNSDAEASLYNAGFAFVNAKLPDSAARAFEAYAKKYPQNTESPNLLFKSVEMFGELQNWEKVAELQMLFTRRYATDKIRLIQALCMGGTAAYQRGRRDEAISLFKQVLGEFASLKNPDATARFYTAQSQHTLGEIAAKKMHDAQIRITNFDGDLKIKTTLLKSAVDEYLKVLDYRIVDWTIRSAFSLGLSFEDFGNQVFATPHKMGKSATDQLNGEEDAIAALTGAYSKAQQQYFQVLSIARKQEINNKWVEDAAAHLISMAAHYEEIQIKAMAAVPQLMKLDVSTPEKTIASKLQQIGRMTPYHEQSMKYFIAFLDIAQEYEFDAKALDSLGQKIITITKNLAGQYISTVELARSAPVPAGFQPMERFFYQVKMLQEGLPKLESEGIEKYERGLVFAAKYNFNKDAITDSLRIAYGKALFIQAKCLDLLSQEALMNPPIPAEAGPEQRKTFMEKMENVGYQLQDQAVDKYRKVVAQVVAGNVNTEWGELAFARLYQIEPDRWNVTENIDSATVIDTSKAKSKQSGIASAPTLKANSVLEIFTGKEWQTLAALPPSGWPLATDSIWSKARKGLVPKKKYPPEVKANFKFLWAGDKGQGPKIDSVIANYSPWKQIYAQTQFEAPKNGVSVNAYVVGQGEWKLLIDKDSVLDFHSAKGPWENGVNVELDGKVVRTLTPGMHQIRVIAQNQKPEQGFGIWIRIQIHYRLDSTGPVFPWNKTPTTTGHLKQLRERELNIPNFSSKLAR